MRFASSIFGFIVGLTVYAAMIYADFADEYRYGNYWIVRSGANIYLGFAAFLVALVFTAFATWRLPMWIAQVSHIAVSLLFGMTGYLIAQNVYHASWHPDKGHHWAILIGCVGIGVVFCLVFKFLKSVFKPKI